MRFVRNGVRLCFFSTITTLGTPIDITLEELRIESLFPADEQPASRTEHVHGLA
ncbi:MAG: hypothetical protein U0Q16_10225 [Bryobacteraceae bacterium]